MPLEQFFGGRTVIIATKHKKDRVIAPLLIKHLNIGSFTPFDLDTDVFGTFSGEIERLQTPLEAARSKCELAMNSFGYDLALANEGSFGPHPEIGFLPVNEELLLFVDKKNNLEVMVLHRTMNTNFSGTVVTSEQELQSFADAAQFPSHALILRKNKEETIDLQKGIVDSELLFSTFKMLMQRYGEVFVETDMRALYNPTRMQVIAEAAEKLLVKIKSCCPSCERPGFGVVEVVAGLPCAACGADTRAVKAHVYRCATCLFEELKPLPNDKEFEDPGGCDYCNP